MHPTPVTLNAGVQVVLKGVPSLLTVMNMSCTFSAGSQTEPGNLPCPRLSWNELSTERHTVEGEISTVIFWKKGEGIYCH